MVGAPILAANAALRMGAGLVRVAVPTALASVVHGHLAEAMTIALPQGEDGQALAAGADRILGGFGSWEALALGPGLGRFPDTDRFVLRILGGWNGPLVVDADALNTLAAWGPDSWVPRARELRAGGETGGAVLTPHPGELSRLTGQSIESLTADPIATARVWAQRWGVTLLFKGAPSVVAAPDGRVWVNSTGNSGLATGGSGDVLSGMIAALLAQGLDGPGASILGSYVHGLAADLWAHAGDRAQRSLLPRDVIETLPAALAWVQAGKTPPRWCWRSL
jgi:NAD(P)H-hydrate epimerase